MNSSPVSPAAVIVWPATTGVPFESVTMPLAGRPVRVTIRLSTAVAGSSGTAMPMAVAPAFTGTVRVGENTMGATATAVTAAVTVIETVPLAVCPALSRTV